MTDITKNTKQSFSGKKVLFIFLVAIITSSIGLSINGFYSPEGLKINSSLDSRIMSNSTLPLKEELEAIAKIKSLGFGEPTSVMQSKLMDFYSAYINEKVIYIKKDFSYSLFGELVDNDKKINITKMENKVFETKLAIAGMANEDFVIDGFLNTPKATEIIEAQEENEQSLEKIKALGVDIISESDFESEAISKLSDDQSNVIDNEGDLPTFSELPTIEEKKSSIDLDEYKNAIKERIANRMSKISNPIESDSSMTHSSTGEVSKENINLEQIQNGKSTVTYKGSTVHKIGYSSAGQKLNAEEVKEQIIKMYKKIEKVGDKWSVVYPAKGVEKAGIVVFSDPTCPVCKRLHRSIDELNEKGLTVRVLMYPRSLVYGINDPAAQRSMETLEAIWCSADTAAAMTKVYEGGNISNSDCSYVKEQGRANFPASEHYFLGMLFNIKGTPLSFTSEGTLISGFSTADSFLKRIGIN